LVALANFMRLSLTKAAHVDVGECRVAGNPVRFCRKSSPSAAKAAQVLLALSTG
jgi:hypothetical protein